MQNGLASVVDRVNAATVDERADFRSELQSYTRLYAFLSQLIPFDDIELEKLYQFARYLWRLLPPEPNQLPTEYSTTSISNLIASVRQARVRSRPIHILSC